VLEELVIKLKPNHHLFLNTSKQLTAYNQKMLIIFLLLFNLAVNSILIFYVYSDQKTEIIALTNQESKELQANNGETISSLIKNEYKPPVTRRKRGMFLNYFIDSKNVLHVRDEVSSIYQKSIEKTLQGWEPNTTHVVLKKIHPPSKEELYLMIAAQNLYDSSNHYEGTIYIGKDLTFFISLITQFFIISFSLSLLFLFLALYIGKKMTNQAMRPIIHSFDLQQEFIANASHELRTPLSVIQAGLDIIDLEKNLLSSFSIETLNDIKNEIRSTTQLVNDLLFLTRSDASQVEINKTEFELNEFLINIIRPFQLIASKKKQTLTFQTNKPTLINQDQEKLKQLIYIFLDNAIKYTPEKGVITIQYNLIDAQKKPKLTIEILDSGIGISSSDLEHIFDRFYRIEKHRSRTEGSTGLGLSIAKSLVSVLGGSLSVKSQLNKGSKFSIKLPIK